LKLKILYSSRIILLLMLLFMLACSSVQAKVLELVQGQEEYGLGLYVDLLEDPSGELSITDIQQAQYQNGFVPSMEEKPSLGFTSSAYWARITIRNNQAKSRLYYLVVDYPPLDYLDFFYPSESGYGQYQAGDLRDFDQRPLQCRESVFR